MERIQIIAIAASFLFLICIGYLILKGKLREEYAIVWIVCTVILILFSLWRKGIDIISGILGIIDPPNMIFTGAIFAMLVYLLHLSVTVSKLQKQNKVLAQEIALMREKEKKETKK
jgi:hypothetical protein